MANITKAEHREDLSRLLGVWWPVIASGNGANNTLVCAALAGYQNNTFKGQWLYFKSGTTAGTDDGKYRQVTSFDGATGTFTFTPALTNTTVANIVAEVNPHRPDWYTECALRAATLVWPALCVPTLDGSLTATSGDFTYTLPSGITAEMITQVMEEGEGNFDELPHRLLEDVSFSPDGSILWLNRTNLHRYRDVTTGHKLYLFARKRLTNLDRDTTFGQLTNDSTAKIELVRDTPQWALFLMFSKAAMYERLATQPQAELRDYYQKMARSSMAEAMDARENQSQMTTGALENPWLGI